MALFVRKGGSRHAGQAALPQRNIHHYADIKSYASIIESRLDDDDCTLESVIEDNRKVLELAIAHEVNYILIDDEYKIDIDLER